MIIRVSRVLNIYSKFKTNSVKSKLWFGVGFLPLSFVFFVCVYVWCNRTTTLCLSFQTCSLQCKLYVECWVLFFCYM